MYISIYVECRCGKIPVIPALSLLNCKFLTGQLARDILCVRNNHSLQFNNNKDY